MELILTMAAILSGLLCISITLWGGYYLITGLMSWRKPMDYGHHPAHTRFAVLIAARNEEQVIGPLVKSLLSQKYPSELYDVWVIPNNCTDNTAQAAQSAGAKVLECTVPVKSKGEVLRFAYQRLRGRSYDAYCVFDADNLVDENFLMQMNNARMTGAKAAQGYRDSKNPYDTAISGCYSIYYWMMNRFYNAGKAALGLSAMINGTGFMITTAALEQLGGWNAHTISEDLELTAQCTLAGIKVHWVPKAITYDEQPLDYALSVKQRRRWSSGTLQVAGCYLRPTWKAVATSPTPGALVDFASTLLIPTYQVAALCNMLVGIVIAALNSYQLKQVPQVVVVLIGLNLLCSIAGSTIAAAIVLTAERKWNRQMLKGLALYWLFLLSWMPITIGSFLKKTTVWEEIRHTRNVVPQAICKGRSLVRL